LFASAQPGVWYDPSDLTTMFQDNLGSTPVTAPGQTVGLLLDKSQNGVGTNGSSRRNLLVATATLSTQSVTVTAVAHTLSFTGTGTVTLTGASIAGPLIGTGASNRVSLTFTPTAASLTLTVVGSVTLAQLELGSAFTTYQPITSSWAATIAGNHATQATSTQRPIYGINPITGTRNLLTQTEFANGVTDAPTRGGLVSAVASANFGAFTTSGLSIGWDGVTTNFAYKTITSVVTSYAFSVYVLMDTDGPPVFGSATAASSGNDFALIIASAVPAPNLYTVEALGGRAYRVSGTDVGIAGSRNAGVIKYPTNSNRTFTVTGYQIEQSATATAYQKVVSQYEVTQAGVQSASYISFDGVDDGMVTGTITPGTNKVQVFAGVRKLSDATTGIVVEASTALSSNLGAFFLAAPNGATSNYSFVSKGSVPTFGADGLANGFAAPTTNVVTGLGDISGDRSTIRVNGTQVAQATTDQGTGNFLAYPLYIGRRAGATLPLNGRIYSLIVRFGTNLTTGQITSTEKWVNTKTGAY
jgi:hypothetical protein